jgi:hypothetical protein
LLNNVISKEEGRELTTITPLPPRPVGPPPTMTSNHPERKMEAASKQYIDMNKDCGVEPISICWFSFLFAQTFN